MNRREASKLVGRLLGPTAPEIGCDECFEQLDEYVEAELAGLDAAAIYPRLASHLQGCPACREESESLRAYLAARPRS